MLQCFVCSRSSPRFSGSKHECGDVACVESSGVLKNCGSAESEIPSSGSLIQRPWIVLCQATHVLPKRDADDIDLTSIQVALEVQTRMFPPRTLFIVLILVPSCLKVESLAAITVRLHGFIPGR